MHITALAGGVGGARFLRGLVDHLATTGDTASTVTIIGNTGDDITLFGLRVCPDIDTLLYTLGHVVSEEQGWGRAQESTRVQAELIAYGAQPDWFTLGDLDMAAHIVRSQWFADGLTHSEVTARFASRWGLPEQRVTLLPMTDSPVETHVTIRDEAAESGTRRVHFQQWWVAMRAAVPALGFTAVGVESAEPAPGVLEAIRDADVILLPPSNPVVSIGIILEVPGIRDALRSAHAPVVGVSPLISGRPVRGHADACLAAIGVPSTTRAVAGLYEDFLDGWLVDPADASDAIGISERVTTQVCAGPLLMADRSGAEKIAATTLDLATGLR